MTERMFDLSIEFLLDGGIRLQQSAGSLEEPAVIDLHTCQIRLIAEQAGILNPAGTQQEPSGLPVGYSLSPAFAWPHGFLRRLERIHLQIADLVDFLSSIPSFPHRSEMDEDEVLARALLDAFDDLLTDFGILPDDGACHGNSDVVTENVTENTPPTGINVTPPGISVTPTAPASRGRPRSPSALTPAERQAKCRAKQCDGTASLELEVTA